MKQTITLLSLAFVATMVLAQPESAAVNGGTALREARMENGLGLTAEQVQKMREIRDSGGSMADMREVLTPEQQAKAVAMRKDTKGNKAERQSPMQGFLDLSDEQRARMAQIRQDGGSAEEIRAVLTPEQLEKFDTLRTKHGWKNQAPQ